MFVWAVGKLMGRGSDNICIAKSSARRGRRHHGLGRSWGLRWQHMCGTICGARRTTFGQKVQCKEQCHTWWEPAWFVTMSYAYESNMRLGAVAQPVGRGIFNRGIAKSNATRSAVHHGLQQGAERTGAACDSEQCCEQFGGSCRAVSEQFRSSFGAVMGQFRSSFGAVSGAVLEHFSFVKSAKTVFGGSDRRVVFCHGEASSLRSSLCFFATWRRAVCAVVCGAQRWESGSPLGSREFHQFLGFDRLAFY